MERVFLSPSDVCGEPEALAPSDQMGVPAIMYCVCEKAQAPAPPDGKCVTLPNLTVGKPPQVLRW